MKLASTRSKGSPEGNTASVCTVDHAESSPNNRVLDDPGPIVIGAAQGASCRPAYEFAHYRRGLRKRRLRRKVPITFVTPEPYIGHLGLSGVGDSKALEHELREDM